MKKTLILWILLDSLFLIVFNIIFFLVAGTEHNESVWISYGFIHFAYIMLLVSPLLVKKSPSAAVFGYSVEAIGITYFMVELVAGIIFIIVAPENWTIALSVQIVIAFIYGIFILSHLIANEHTAASEFKSQAEIRQMKMAASELAGIMDNTADAVLKKKIEKVFEAIKYSPTKSHIAVSSVENDILNGISSLKSLAAKEEKAACEKQIDSLLRLISERNRKLRTLN
jgi:hypothetical protein